MLFMISHLGAPSLPATKIRRNQRICMKFHGLTSPRIERPFSVIPLAERVATFASIDADSAETEKQSAT